MNKSELVENILSRLQELKEVRSKFESSWMQAERLVAPSIYAWHDLDAVPSAPKRFASEPCQYMQTLVAGLVGYSISPSIQWFKLSLQNAGYGIGLKTASPHWYRSSIGRISIPSFQSLYRTRSSSDTAPCTSAKI